MPEVLRKDLEAVLLRNKSSLNLCGVPAFTDFFNQLGVKRRQIIGLAARYQAIVDDDRCVFPAGSRVFEILPQ